MRDKAIERLLEQMPAGTGRRGPGPCLEPETLAAWMEGTLSVADRGIAESHAAGCDRCQAMLAAMVRSEPPPLGAARWWSAGAIRWAVPLVAAAAVFALWVAIDPEALRSPAPLPAAQVVAPVAPPVAVAGNQSTAREAPLRSEAPTAAPARDQAAKTAAPRNEKDEVSRRAENAASPPPALLDKKVDAVKPASEERKDAVAEMGNRAPVAGSPPAVVPPAREQVAAARSSGDATVPVIASPAASTRWRIVSPARVERSTDAGVTWAVTDLPAGVQVTAGVSPAAGVCWLVGRDGLVLRTVDGSTWTRIAFPEPLVLTSVESSGTEAAVVTAGNGRSFATSDGGRTWVPRTR